MSSFTYTICEYDRHFSEFVHCPGGRVHSVYEKAINIWNGRNLYAIVADREGAAPYTANTQNVCFGGCGIKPGDEVSGVYPLMRIGSEHVFEFCSARMFDCSGPDAVFEEGKLRSGLSYYESCLQKKDIRKGCADFYRRYYSGEMLPKPELLQGELNRRLAALAESSDLAAFQKAAGKLVGAGIGLTPSGDDFLCGVMEAFESSKMALSWIEQFKSSLKNQLMDLDTTDVSRQMFKACLDGEFPRLHKNLAAAFLEGGDGMEEAMGKIETIGHSSGIDFSAGLASGYNIILEKVVRCDV